MESFDKSKYRILFVDNSRTTRATMEKLLQQQGYQTESIATGQEAIAKAQLGIFDLIIMDLYMPKMNGHEAAKKIRDLENEQINAVPILALTASHDPKDIQVSQNAGMNKFVKKSNDYTELFNTIVDLLEKK